ncbi:MAG: hypothetical protein U1A77_10770 [Pirellulales bacterium]
MSFLLDTDICSAHIKQRGGLTHRLVQYAGRLHVSVIAVGELYTWAMFDREGLLVVFRPAAQRASGRCHSATKIGFTLSLAREMRRIHAGSLQAE